MQKNSKFTQQIIIYILSFVLAANVLFGFLMLRTSIDTLRNQIRERMLDISNTAAGLLDGDVLEKISYEDRDTPEYRNILNILSTFQQKIQLAYIYGIRDMGDGNFTFTIDPDPVTSGEFGSPVTYTDALYEASLGTASVDKTPYTDQWGRFYSAYSPVFSSEGKVAGIIGVDFKAEWYEKQLYRHIFIIIFACVFSLLGGAGIVFIITGKLQKRFALLNSEMNL